MATINPNDSGMKKSYDHQEELANSRVPPTGKYHVVIKTIAPQLVGANASKKVRMNATILSCVESADGGEGWVGQNMPLDFWWNFDKRFNATRLTHLAMACGVKEAFDPDDDSALVHAVTGVPFFIQVEKTSRSYQKDGETKTVEDVEPVEFKRLAPKDRKKHTDDPGWRKLLPATDERMLETEDYSKPRGSAAGGGADQQADPDEEDLPFS